MHNAILITLLPLFLACDACSDKDQDTALDTAQEATDSAEEQSEGEDTSEAEDTSEEGDSGSDSGE